MGEDIVAGLCGRSAVRGDKAVLAEGFYSLLAALFVVPGHKFIGEGHGVLLYG